MIIENKKRIALTGGYAAAEALRQVAPDVMPVYPITPQTTIIETFAKFKADGVVETEVIEVESEHSAMSACVGSSAAGARTVTATSSQGLEGIYFTLSEFSRLPRAAFKGFASVVFVWLLPVVVVSNAPAETLLHGFSPRWALAIFAAALLWLGAAIFAFYRGLRRYSSASS